MTSSGRSERKAKRFSAVAGREDGLQVPGVATAALTELNAACLSIRLLKFYTYTNWCSITTEKNASESSDLQAVEQLLDVGL
jgi:hypothetical protein